MTGTGAKRRRGLGQTGRSRPGNLQQAVLLEPTVHSYRAAIQMVDELLAMQREVLPALT